jgi:hypothetical protein
VLSPEFVTLQVQFVAHSAGFGSQAIETLTPGIGSHSTDHSEELLTFVPYPSSADTVMSVAEAKADIKTSDISAMNFMYLVIYYIPMFSSQGIKSSLVSDIN